MAEKSVEIFSSAESPPFWLSRTLTELHVHLSGIFGALSYHFVCPVACLLKLRLFASLGSGPFARGTYRPFPLIPIHHTYIPFPRSPPPPPPPLYLSVCLSFSLSYPSSSHLFRSYLRDTQQSCSSISREYGRFVVIR